MNNYAGLKRGKGGHIAWLLAVTLYILMNSCGGEQPEIQDIRVTFNDSLFREKVSGKLIFMFDSDTSSSLVYGVDPERPHPVYTYDLDQWDPGDTLRIDRFSGEWFKQFSELEGEYVYRVIFDRDTIHRSSFVAHGNGYSERQKIFLSRERETPIAVAIDKVFQGWVFTGTPFIREEKFRSTALSSYWGFEVDIEAAVVLPEDYYESPRDYPLVFVFPGFGSNHAAVTYGNGQLDRYGMNRVGEDKVFVFMNAEFFQGYHHFADSENNGPWGKAFTQEFLPYIETRYRVKDNPSQRFLMGQSSGAWTAVWLQVAYPDLFGGAYAASPDPLDFRAQAFNIYLPNANFYVPPDPDSSALEEGARKKLYAELESLLGEFGQVRTWEATFSPKTPDGTIAPLFDRSSGTIDPSVADHWKNYDISRIISSDPDRFREQLQGKLHIYVSEDDPYGLAKSVKLLEKVLEENHISADIQYFTGLGHNVWTDELRKHIHGSMDTQQE